MPRSALVLDQTRKAKAYISVGVLLDSVWLRLIPARRRLKRNQLSHVLVRGRQPQGLVSTSLAQGSVMRLAKLSFQVLVLQPRSASVIIAAQLQPRHLPT